jgi:hypothetical protein
MRVLGRGGGCVGRESGTDLVLSCCAPVGDAGWVCDAFFEAVGAESAERDA